MRKRRARVNIRTKAWQKLLLVFAGLVIALVIAEGCLRLGGAWLLWRQRHGNSEALLRGRVGILAIGESTTQGISHLTDNVPYPEQLEKLLRSRLGNDSVAVINEGVAGTTSYEIAQQINGYLDRYHPQVVVTMMGINDNGLCKAAPDRHFSGSLRILKLLRLLFKTITHQNSPVQVSGKIPAESNRAWELATLGSAYVPKNMQLALRYHLQAHKLLPRETYFLSLIARDYERLHMTDQELKTLESIVPLARDSPTGIVKLGDFYLRTGRPAKREQVLRAWVDDHGERADGRVIQGLIGAMRAQGRDPSRYERMLERIWPSGEVTCAANYRWIAETILRRGIKLVAVQYPMLSVESLKKMLSGLEWGEPAFVENRDNFLAALKVHSDHEIFTDHFAGDFGHCTKFGYSLLAERVADAVQPLLKPGP